MLRWHGRGDRPLDRRSGLRYLKHEVAELAPTFSLQHLLDVLADHLLKIGSQVPSHSFVKVIDPQRALVLAAEEVPLENDHQVETLVRDQEQPLPLLTLLGHIDHGPNEADRLPFDADL